MMFFKRLISFVVLIVLLASLPVLAAGYKDFEWKDSPEEVREKFDGEVIKLDAFEKKIEDEAANDVDESLYKIFVDGSSTPNINYLLGETSFDGKPYAIQFVFFEDKLIQICLVAKDKSETIYQGVTPNRPVDRVKGWDVMSEYLENLNKLNAKYGEAKDQFGMMFVWEINGSQVRLMGGGQSLEVTYSYDADTPWWKSYTSEQVRLDAEKAKKSDF